MPSPVSPDYRRTHEPATRIPPRPAGRATVGVAAPRYPGQVNRTGADRGPDGPPAGPRYGGPPAREIRRRQRQRMRRRRRRVALVALLLMVAVAIGAGLMRGWGSARDLMDLRAASDSPGGAVATAAGAQASAPPTLDSEGGAPPSAAPTGPLTYTGPVTGPGTFSFAGTKSPVLGTAGTLHRFRVAVEKGTGQHADTFAAAAVRTLGDKRSWIAGHNVRLQQVPAGSAYDFTLFLATPGTSEKMCLAGGLHTQKFTSCRLPGKVIINLARWLTAIPDYDAPLSVYQQYAIDHEVGHELGHGHEACPGPGKLAPVMQQQTYGLKGCLANPWAYLDGKRYAGLPIP